MEILFVGDTHITNRKPECRKDVDYLHTLLDKLEQVERIGRKYKCDYALQSGDWFDSWAVGRDVISEIIRFLKKSKMQWFCVYGQHDIYGHSAESFAYSSLRILQEAGVIIVLGKKPVSLLTSTEPEIHLYGAPFGEEVGKVEVSGDHVFNILVVHQMIGDVQLYPDQNLEHPAAFLRKNPDFDLVLAGDYHYRFSSRVGDRICINPGAMVRKSIKEEDLNLKPAVVVFDTRDRMFEVVKLDVVPSEEIFDLEVRPEKEEVDVERLLKFLDDLKKSSGSSIGWQKILTELLFSENVSDRVKGVLDGCIAEVEREGVK